MQHPEDHDITALAYDLIEGPEREALLGHLAECDRCRAVYDSYRDEQVAVREAIVRDARSGAAEAKALESTLKMLGAIDAPEEEATSKRGRLLRMPVWVLAAEIAAMAVVAVGLFFILKPGPDNTPNDNGVIPVAKADRAPASVDEGVVYVRDTQGEWKQADAMPVDEWVRAGDSQPVSFTLANGSKAELQPNAVFRIALESAGGEPVVYLLHGDGTFDTRNIDSNVLVRTGDASFVTMPGARVQFECKLNQADRQSPRQWSRPTYVGARVLDGDVVLRPTQRGHEIVPLRNGEKLEWNDGEMQIIELSGEPVSIPFEPWFGPNQTDEDNPFQIQMRLRLEELLKRIQQEGRPVNKDMKDLEKELKEIELKFGNLKTPTDIHEPAILKDGETIFTVSSDGKQITVAIFDSTGSEIYSANSVEALKAKVPERYHEKLNGLKFKTDDKGNIRVIGGDSKGGIKIKIEQHSDSETESSSSSGD